MIHQEYIGWFSYISNTKQHTPKAIYSQEMVTTPHVPLGFHCLSSFYRQRLSSTLGSSILLGVF